MTNHINVANVLTGLVLISASYLLIPFNPGISIVGIILGLYIAQAGRLDY